MRLNDCDAGLLFAFVQHTDQFKFEGKAASVSTNLHLKTTCV